MLTQQDERLPGIPHPPWSVPRRGACPGPTPRAEEGTNGWCLFFADFVSLQGTVDKRTQMGLLHLACMMGVAGGVLHFRAEKTELFGADF